MASQAYSHRTYPVPAQCLRILRLLAVASAMLQAQGYSVSTYLFGCKTFWRRFCDFYVPNDAEFVNQRFHYVLIKKVDRLLMLRRVPAG